MFYSESNTLSTTKEIITTKNIHWKTLQLTIRIQDMSTATYVAVGGFDSQDYRITATNQPFTISAEEKHIGIKNPKIHPQQKWFDMMDIWVKADAGTPIIEIFAEVLKEID